MEEPEIVDGEIERQIITTLYTALIQYENGGEWYATSILSQSK